MVSVYTVMENKNRSNKHHIPTVTYNDSQKSAEVLNFLTALFMICNVRLFKPFMEQV